MFGQTSNPIKKLNNGGYDIRVLVSRNTNFNNGNTTEKYDYFNLDANGKILRAPRGYSKDYKGAIVTDIHEAFEKQK